AYSPPVSPRLPPWRVDDLWVFGIGRNVDRPGLRVAIEDPAPGRAAVRALVDSAVGAGAAIFAEAPDEDSVAVGRVDPHPRKVLDILKPDVLPALAGIGRLIDSVPGHDVATKLGLAG